MKNYPSVVSLKEQLESLIATNSLVYCYLDRVYTDSSDKSILYQVTLSDFDFTSIFFGAVDSEMLAFLSKSNLHCDFATKEGSLYAKDVDRVLVVDSLVKAKNTFIPVYNLQEHNFYTFLRNGISNDFLILEDSLEDLQIYRGTAFSAFKSIKFSSTSMTAYVSIYKDEKMYNKMLVTIDDGVLNLETFIFAVPEECSLLLPGFEELGKIEINNRRYIKYRSKLMNLYTEVYSTSKALINKACLCHEKYKAAIDTLHDLKKVIADDVITYTWVGGKTDYRGEYGVYFTSSEKKLSRDTRAALIEKVKSEYLSQDTCYDAFHLIEQSSMSIVAKSAAIALCSCLYNSSDEVSLLQNIETLLSVFKRDLTYTDLFLYSVRTGAYIRKRYLANPVNPILEGSDEDCYTVVQQSFKRG